MLMENLDSILTFYVINQCTHINVRRLWGSGTFQDRVRMLRNQGLPDTLLLTCLTWSPPCPQSPAQVLWASVFCHSSNPFPTGERESFTFSVSQHEG